MTYGAIFRQIRINKGMKLKEAAGDTLSPSQLSRFENGLSMVTVETFYEALKNINATPQEFLFLVGDSQDNELNDAFKKIENLANTSDLINLKKLRDSWKKEVKTPYQWKHFLVLFIDNLLHVFETEHPLNQSEILDYLMQVEDWGEMELRIYTLFGFVFEVDTTYHLMKSAVKKSRKYMALPQDAKLLFTILSNNFSTFIFHKRFDYALETLKLYGEQLDRDVKLLDPHLDFLFNQGILAFCQHDEEDGIALCEKVIELCQLFKQTENLERYEKRYQNWLHGHKDPGYKELTINIWTID
ncbi:Rgg/GadR/MutR family transcriptional regulator [Jeotgalibaca porci]|uniref:Rgg/GadR/MutR family transcriptional regulator n=1 Tax=Jeotgalibaca porci TaxID=1868793 RepID=UPI0035A08999